MFLMFKMCRNSLLFKHEANVGKKGDIRISQRVFFSFFFYKC